MNLAAGADPLSTSIVPIWAALFLEMFVLLSTCSPQRVEYEFV